LTSLLGPTNDKGGDNRLLNGGALLLVPLLKAEPAFFQGSGLHVLVGNEIDEDFILTRCAGI